MALKEDLAKAIDVSYFRRWTRVRGWLAALYLLPALAAGAWLAVRFRADDRRAYAPGPVSSAHETFGDRCEACHAEESWRPVQALAVGDEPARRPVNERCLVCHGASVAADGSTATALHARAPGATKPTEPFLACATCHGEHQGLARLEQVADRECARCHADLAAHGLGAGGRVRPSGERIPSILEHAADFAALEKRDPSVFRFPHAKHLEHAIAGPSGEPVTLACTDCHEDRAHAGRFAREAPHESDPGRAPRAGRDALMRPIRYSLHCAACHPLAVDERLAGDATIPPGCVPHQAPSLVRSWLRGQLFAYAENRPDAAPVASPIATSRIGLVEPRAPEAGAPEAGGPSHRLGLVAPREPGPRVATAVPLDRYRPPADRAARLAWVEEEVAAIESRLYASPGGTCGACHPAPAGATSLPFEPAPRPMIPERWLESGRFDHARHEQVACAACHRFRRADGTLGEARDSRSAADVLLEPGIAGCRVCHAPPASDPAGRAIAPSRCTTCHTYHRPPERGGGH